jgi:RNA polymerase sigma factor (sigma-70 family)
MRAMDLRLVDRAQRGDHDAFAALVAATADRHVRIARLILRDTERAEDAVQEALIKVWRELPRLRELDRFEAWATRILVNACRDEARRSRRRVEFRIVPEIETPDTAADVIARERLERAFERLPLEQRVVLVLHHYAGLSQSEIAAATGRPVGTVKSRLSYAIASMRSALEADDRTARPAAPRRTA